MVAPLLDPELQRRLLAAYLAGTDPDPAGVRALAARYRLLPVYLDWTGFVGLRDDGELLFTGWDPPQEPAVIEERWFRRIALAEGARRFPELGPLRPVRPPDAVACSGCGGTGVLTIDGRRLPDNILCSCGGLGWIPAEEQDGFQPSGA